MPALGLRRVERRELSAGCGPHLPSGRAHVSFHAGGRARAGRVPFVGSFTKPANQRLYISAAQASPVLLSEQDRPDLASLKNGFPLSGTFIRAFLRYWTLVGSTRILLDS